MDDSESNNNEMKSDEDKTCKRSTCNSSVDHNLQALSPVNDMLAKNLEGLKLESDEDSQIKAEDVAEEETEQQTDTSTIIDEFVHDEEGSEIQKKIMNVLILGQSGVGKSTWVNSIFNYLQYETLDEAEKQGPICVIPASFTVSVNTEEKFENCLIQIGDPDGNEVTATGKSATQDPKTYRFNFKDKLVNLIDTPGLGDTRGIESDKENMKKILDHINSFDEIHAIVIFMKSNEVRIGAVFRFCILELLTNLHKNAAKNIIFCFTNSRSSFYTPGDTSAVLENLIKELHLSDMIPLTKKTMFCMDNEAFRFLCTLQYKNIQRTADERKMFESSWIQSVKETKRLFEQVEELTPHVVTDTTTLCKARNRILLLTKPLAEIQMTIQMNLSVIADRERRMANSKLDLDSLSKKLFIPHIELRAFPLRYPRTVCTSKKCVKFYQLGNSGIMQTEYVQICHDNCSLKNIATDKYPQSGLRGCWAMKCGESTECQFCGCKWDVHMHITYHQKRVETLVRNSHIENEITLKKTAKQQIEDHINKLKETTKQYEEEQKIIMQTSLKFGVFLRENAITPYNDGFKDYFKYLIEQEKQKVNRTQIDDDILKNLNEMMRMYEEEVKILEESMKNSSVGQNFTPEDIRDLEMSLYNLKLTGKEIKRNVKMSMACNKRAQKNLEQVVMIDHHQSKPNFFKRTFSKAMSYFFPNRNYEPIDIMNFF